MTNTVFINAKLVDGTGNVPQQADVIVQGNTVCQILKPGTASLQNAIAVDATGLTLTPGFIDCHGHSDTTVIDAPQAEAKIAQGITTEITGNCGCSKCIEVMPHWDNLKDYATAVNQARPAINTATLAGHNSLRERIIGYQDRHATRQELKTMKDILQQALEQGACGFSGGLWYLPGKYAPTEEMLELATTLQNTGKPYANHMRSEGDGILEALNEAIRIAQAGDRKLQISHLKAAPKRNWDKIFNVFQTIETYQKQGLQIFSDRYPYTYSSTGLRQVMGPPWNRIKDLKTCLRNPPNAKDALQQLEQKHTDVEDWQKIILLDELPQIAPQTAGKTVWELARELKLKPAELIIRILTACAPAAAFGKMSERNMKLIIAKPWVFPCTDAAAVPCDGSLGTAHPRAFGSFPNFFHIARQNAPLQEVIRRMTALPANFFNLANRGLIKPGYAADLLLFKEDDYLTKATYRYPHRLPTGVKAVYVNGQLAYNGSTQQVVGRSGTFIHVPNQTP